MTINFDFLPQTFFAFFMIFSRIGTVLMVIPGIGDRAVPMRSRLVFGLAMSLVLYTVLKDKIPQMPIAVYQMLWFLIYEVLLGLAIGFTIRMIIAGLQAAGEVIAVQTGLAFAQNVDPSQGTQGTLISNFLSLLAVVLIFMADLHHVMLRSIFNTYALFPAGLVFPAGDFAQLGIRILGQAFLLSLQLSAPFLVFGLVFYLGVGILARLIPQVQIFFVAMPANIFFGFILFMVLLSTLMRRYLEYFGEAFEPYLP